MIGSENLKKFFYNIKKYYKYSIYAAKAELKSEITNSYLNWLWWFLDPISYMLIYTFIVEVVFKTTEQYFPVFVFIGLTTWDLFSKTVSGSVKLVKNNIGTINKVYLPKYILLVSKSFVFLFKFLISFTLIIVLMLLFKVPFSWQILNFPIILFIIYTISFGCGTILLHFGVFVEDLSNIVNILLKLVFYFSGIFYAIATRIPAPFNKLMVTLNPVAFCIDQFRRIFLYGAIPNYLLLFLWFIAGIILIVIGVSLINKYENSYAKVV